MEIVLSSEPVRAGVDGLSGLLKELASLVDAPVKRFGCSHNT